jgi:7,8-dihydroneopterin aldolase/epimerase/oxygenase
LPGEGTNAEKKLDIVYVRDLRIETIIGIYDWERQVRQTVSLDLEMASDIRQAAATDDIQYALNYKAVSKRLIAYVENRNALLVETLAEEIAKIIREEFKVPWLRLRLSKPGAVRGARDVGLIIERGVKPE